MRKMLIAILMSVFAVAMVIAGVIRSTPTASSTLDGYVAIRWQTDDETGVQKFEIWRAQIVGAGLGDFVKVGDLVRPDVKPDTYEFIDQTVFKTSASLFAYKVRVVFQNGTYSDSDLARVSHVSSAAKRTWGSIKAMFR
jgi:hypothetical protein